MRYHGKPLYSVSKGFTWFYCAKDRLQAKNKPLTLLFSTVDMVFSHVWTRLNTFEHVFTGMYQNSIPPILLDGTSNRNLLGLLKSHRNITYKLLDGWYSWYCKLEPSPGWRWDSRDRRRSQTILNAGHDHFRNLKWRYLPYIRPI